MRIILTLMLLATSIHALEPEMKVIESVNYYIFRTSAEKVRMTWSDEKKIPYRDFAAVLPAMHKAGEKPLMLMNGGIFEPGGIPSGLYWEKGVEKNPLNLRDAPGNFFLKPNGVFLIRQQKAEVVDAKTFISAGVTYAVQSGPLLLNKGIRHPAFTKNSINRLHRNGVGVDKNGMVIFMMSQRNSRVLPNLYEFAEAFRSLGCENALFLDGDISQMQWGATLGKSSNLFGTIISIVE